MEGADLESRRTEQEIDAWLDVSNEDRTGGNVGMADATKRQLRSTSLSSGSCSLKEESGTMETLGEPSGKAVEKVIQASSEVPAVLGKVYEDGEDLHPLWQLLELAGYDMQ